MRKKQEGYLLLVSVILLMVMGVLAVTMVRMSSANSTSTLASTLETQAYYVAESGLHMGVRYWFKNTLACSAITDNAALTNITFGPGQFTVTAENTQNSTKLSTAITASATTIPLVSTSNFPPEGAIIIGTEGIYYTGISGNSLTGAIRGAGSTVAAAQANASTVTQNQCVITSTGAVKTLASPIAKRTMAATMFSFPATSGNLISPIAAIGSVTFVNGSVANGHSCLLCDSYAGANIQTNSTNNTFSGFSSQVDANAPDGGNLTTSSYQGSIKADIKQGATFTTTTLYSMYFSKARTYLAANATYVGTNVLNRSGVIYANGNVNVSNGQLGSLVNPVLMYVAGSLTMSSVSVYGVIYATGPVNITNLSMVGAIASESTYYSSGIGLTYNFSMVNAMSNNATYSDFMSTSGITGAGGESPNADAANIQEVFS